MADFLLPILAYDEPEEDALAPAQEAGSVCTSMRGDAKQPNHQPSFPHPSLSASPVDGLTEASSAASASTSAVPLPEIGAHANNTIAQNSGADHLERLHVPARGNQSFGPAGLPTAATGGPCTARMANGSGDAAAARPAARHVDKVSAKPLPRGRRAATTAAAAYSGTAAADGDDNSEDAPLSLDGLDDFEARRRRAVFTAMLLLLERGARDSDQLSRLVAPMSGEELQQVAEERALAGHCGNPLCGAAHTISQPQPRRRWDPREGFLEPPPPSHFCSAACELLIESYATQLGDPLERLQPGVQELLAVSHAPRRPGLENVAAQGNGVPTMMAEVRERDQAATAAAAVAGGRELDRRATVAAGSAGSHTAVEGYEPMAAKRGRQLPVEVAAAASQTSLPAMAVAEPASEPRPAPPPKQFSAGGAPPGLKPSLRKQSSTIASGSGGNGAGGGNGGSAESAELGAGSGAQGGLAAAAATAEAPEAAPAAEREREQKRVTFGPKVEYQMPANTARRAASAALRTAAAKHSHEGTEQPVLVFDVDEPEEAEDEGGVESGGGARTRAERQRVPASMPRGTLRVADAAKVVAEVMAKAKRPGELTDEELAASMREKVPAGGASAAPRAMRLWFPLTAGGTGISRRAGSGGGAQRRTQPKAPQQPEAAVASPGSATTAAAGASTAASQPNTQPTAADAAPAAPTESAAAQQQPTEPAPLIAPAPAPAPPTPPHPSSRAVPARDAAAPGSLAAPAGSESPSTPQAGGQQQQQQPSGRPSGSLRRFMPQVPAQQRKVVFLNAVSGAGAGPRPDLGPGRGSGKARATGPADADVEGGGGKGGGEDNSGSGDGAGQGGGGDSLLKVDPRSTRQELARMLGGRQRSTEAREEAAAVEPASQPQSAPAAKQLPAGGAPPGLRKASLQKWRSATVSGSDGNGAGGGSVESASAVETAAVPGAASIPGRTPAKGGQSTSGMKALRNPGVSLHDLWAPWAEPAVEPLGVVSASGSSAAAGSGGGAVAVAASAAPKVHVVYVRSDKRPPGGGVPIPLENQPRFPEDEDEEDELYDERFVHDDRDADELADELYAGTLAGADEEVEVEGKAAEEEAAERGREWHGGVAVGEKAAVRKGGAAAAAWPPPSRGAGGSSGKDSTGPSPAAAGSRLRKQSSATVSGSAGNGAGGGSDGPGESAEPGAGSSAQGGLTAAAAATASCLHGETDVTHPRHQRCHPSQYGDGAGQPQAGPEAQRPTAAAAAEAQAFAASAASTAAAAVEAAAPAESVPELPAGLPAAHPATEMAGDADVLSDGDSISEKAAVAAAEKAEGKGAAEGAEEPEEEPVLEPWMLRDDLDSLSGGEDDNDAAPSASAAAAEDDDYNYKSMLPYFHRTARHYHAVLSPYNQIQLALVGWVNSRTVAFVVGVGLGPLHDPGPALEDSAYAEGGSGSGGPPALASALQARGVLLQLLAAPVREACGQLGVRVPLSDLDRKLTALVATFRLSGPIPGFKQPQWMLLALALLHALSTHHIPALRSSLCKPRPAAADQTAVATAVKSAPAATAAVEKNADGGGGAGTGGEAGGAGAPVSVSAAPPPPLHAGGLLRPHPLLAALLGRIGFDVHYLSSLVDLLVSPDF